jgi:hypothetical protein
VLECFNSKRVLGAQMFIILFSRYDKNVLYLSRDFVTVGQFMSVLSSFPVLSHPVIS